jgi:tetratricopeptide (TPR) repeat protein
MIMEPTYFIENAYSIYPKKIQASVAKNYKVDTPESSFEWQVFKLFHEGKTHLYHEEYNLAYDSFKELSYLILKTVHPKLPPDPNANRYTILPKFMELLTPMMARAGEILRDAPVTRYSYPNTIVDVNKRLSPEVEEKVSYMDEAGLRISSYHVNVEDYVDGALNAANDDNWKAALNNYQLAINSIPPTDNELRGSLLHDMAIINEKLNNKDQAIQFGEESIRLFTAANAFAYQVHALKTLSGVLKRGDKPDESKRNLDLAEKIAKDRNLYKINLGSKLNQVNLDKPISDSLLRSIRPLASQPGALAEEVNVMEAVVVAGSMPTEEA